MRLTTTTLPKRAVLPAAFMDYGPVAPDGHGVKGCAWVDGFSGPTPSHSGGESTVSFGG